MRATWNCYVEFQFIYVSFKTVFLSLGFAEYRILNRIYNRRKLDVEFLYLFCLFRYIFLHSVTIKMVKLFINENYVILFIKLYNSYWNYYFGRTK